MGSLQETSARSPVLELSSVLCLVVDVECFNCGAHGVRRPNHSGATSRPVPT
jgi:hypothetical protein